MLSRTPRLLVEPKFQGGAAKADPFSGRSWDTPAAFKSSPCSLQEHPPSSSPSGGTIPGHSVAAASLGAQLGRTCQGDTSKRLPGGVGRGWSQPGVGPDPTFSQGMRVVALIYPGSGMGMAWEGQGDQGGEMVLPLHDNISAEPRLCSWFPGGFSLPGQPETKTPPVLLCKTEKQTQII